MSLFSMWAPKYAFLPPFFPVLDLLVHILPLFTLVVPTILCYRFQPASLASLLFINFQFRFNLVVGSLLSPLDLCNTPSSSKICLAGSHRNLHVQADKLTRFSNWAALQVSGSKTKVTGILYGAAKTGVWGKDPKKHLRTQLSNKILVQGQHAHFIEQSDHFTYLSVELNMSLNWIHQYTRMTETLKQKLTGLRNSYASPWQAIHIINTAIMPSIAYAFPVTPLQP
jgi:hypothetical protein